MQQRRRAHRGSTVPRVGGDHRGPSVHGVEAIIEEVKCARRRSNHRGGPMRTALKQSLRHQERLMSDTVERNTQVGRALANANVSGKRVSGIYIIWPGWSKVQVMKLGLTTTIYSYFDLVGYMVVAPSLVRARETSVLNLASKQNGWETPPHDKEWRRWLGASGDVYMAIAKLLATLRTTVDGLWYTFERGTGKVLMQGGSHILLDQALVLPLIANVLTRSLWGRNVRQAGKVQMNHRKRRGGKVSVATKCCLCYREPNWIRAARYRITHDDKEFKNVVVIQDIQWVAQSQTLKPTVLLPMPVPVWENAHPGLTSLVLRIFALSANKSLA
ncbi:hypothetical protein T492DRAFT_848436 [Pavlovales sp. CCMP2436]|nr:hypothetical protein T492DRAFT_848436 [Pavlovales sp. CCMP2436]